MPFLGERVGMTEAARLHFDSDLSRPGLRNLSLDHLKSSTRATHLDDAHPWAYLFSKNGRFSELSHQTFIPPSTTSKPRSRRSSRSKRKQLDHVRDFRAGEGTSEENQ